MSISRLPQAEHTSRARHARTGVSAPYQRICSAGQSIHVEHETREGTIDSIADYWEPIETGVGSLPQAYVALSETDRRAVRAEVTARLAQFESNGRFVISVETLIARGRA